MAISVIRTVSSFDPTLQVMRADFRVYDKSNLWDQLLIWFYEFFGSNQFDPSVLAAAMRRFFEENREFFSKEFKAPEHFLDRVGAILSKANVRALSTQDSHLPKALLELGDLYQATRIVDMDRVKMFVQKLAFGKKTIKEEELSSMIRFFEQHSEIAQELPKELLDFLKSVDASLKGWIKEADAKSTSGVYFAGKNGSGIPSIVIKPDEEEAYASHNHKSYKDSQTGVVKSDIYHGKTGGKGLRPGLVSGQGAKNEHLAWVMDQVDGGFSEIPTTLRFELKGRKIFMDTDERVVASIQAYKMGYAIQYVKKEQEGDLPQKELEKLAVADIVMGNLDRHRGNALFDMFSKKITPIDHGLSRGSEAAQRCMRFSWLHYKQLTAPMSEVTRRHIEQLDVRNHEAALRAQHVAPEAIMHESLRIYFLKNGAEAGLTMHEIGMVLAFNREIKHSIYFDNVQQMRQSPTVFEEGMRAKLDKLIVYLKDLHKFDDAGLEKMKSNIMAKAQGFDRLAHLHQNLRALQRA